MEYEWVYNLAFFFGLLMLMMISGMPVAFGFLTLNIVGLYFFLGGAGSLSLLATSSFSSIGQFALIPIPLFILMGELLMRTGLAAKTVEAVDQWIGRVPGRLSLSSVGGGTLFGALSGASMASVAMLGSTLVPEMTKRGYKPAMSVSSILAGGGLAVLIPPSALGVLLGALAKVSIAELLLAGILPGVVLATMYFAYFAVRAALQPELAPPYEAPATSIGEKFYSLLTITPLLSLIVVVTGLIFLGVATPSESAAMGVVATLVLAACYGRLTLDAVKQSLMAAMTTTAMMLLVIVGSTGFSQLLAATGSTSALVSAVGDLGLNPILTVIVMQVIVLILGCFIDTISIMLVAIPVFMPIVSAMGLDPIWFCILILVQLELAGITPPFGVLLFVMKGVQQHLKISEIYKAALPIVLIQIALVALLMIFPEIVTLLPNATRN
ncbi:TRAP transporter large permease subunit [Pelagibius sp. Alg239-R121]|uniref:TRAP transporter large permease n=1 Tax=Pelagibius sp. Alg239-R121 TaxID=2993448 RepID=UPI0024A75990|nr:TRAP transporter large permease subunit [Pelagibius sp. Alg239-R121]